MKIEELFEKFIKKSRQENQKNFQAGKSKFLDFHLRNIDSADEHLICYIRSVKSKEIETLQDTTQKYF